MSVKYRKATRQDNFNTFSVFLKSIEDFGQRTGVMAVTGGRDPEKMKQLWERRRALWEHLADTSDQYWLAEKEDGEAIGYARSIVRENHRELTEFFVMPGSQSAGIGKELIRRAFPEDTPHRSIIATPDFRAMARYLKAGLYPFRTGLYFERVPELLQVESDLAFEVTGDSKTALQTIGEIDLAILGYRRDVDHEFLMRDRDLYFYKRGDSVVGYGYLSKDYFGPFALLYDQDFPAILAHAESEAHALGAGSVGFETPAVNTIAVDYLMERGYRIEGFMVSIMSNKPFGRFENYLLSSPPFFL